MKYLVKANPSRKLDKSDEICGNDFHITKKVNLTIQIKEVNHSNDFVTLKLAIQRQLKYLQEYPLEVYGTMEYANQAIAFLKEMLKLCDEATEKCYGHLNPKNNEKFS